MSESKITFHAPVTRDPSAAREIIPVPPAGMQVVPARSDPRAGSGAEQGMNAQFVLHALRRWWKIALPSALILAAIAVAVVCLLFVPQYEASALLEISEHPQYIAFAPERRRFYGILPHANGNHPQPMDPRPCRRQRENQANA